MNMQSKDVLTLFFRLRNPIPLYHLKGGENMYVNVSNLISQLPDSIIKSKNPNNLNEGIFANMLNNAMTENLNMTDFLGNNFESLLSANNIDLEDYNAENLEDDESQNYISYENLISYWDIFFFRPDLAVNEGKENKTLNSDYDVSTAQPPSRVYEQITGLPFNSQSTGTEKLVPEMEIYSQRPTIEGKTESNSKGVIIENLLEAQSEKQIEVSNEKSIETQSEKPIELNEKQKSQFASPELFAAETLTAQNRVITISDSSTEIRSQVLAQVKDKIIIMTEKGQDADGVKTITMELRPKSLGKVDIKMSYENNKLTVEIKALNEETQKILSSNAGELRDLLSKTSRADVDIIVKPYVEIKHQNMPSHVNSQEGYEQNFYQNNEQNHQGRQGNKYYKSYRAKQSQEDVFSELIDLNYSKTKEGVYGN